MDEQIRKYMSSYFLYFYNMEGKWNSVMERARVPLSTLKNQTEQLSHIEKVNIEKEFCDFPGIKEKLLFKVFISIEEELVALKGLVSELDVAVQGLRNRLSNFEKSTLNVDWENSKAIAGSALHPSLSDLLQMALMGWRIYNDKYQNIANIFKSLDIRDQKSVGSLNLSFDESDTKNINEIVALTQYCYE